MNASNTRRGWATRQPASFLSLVADRLLGAALVEQAGDGLDQRLGVAVDVGKVTELPRQQHGAPAPIVG